MSNRQVDNALSNYFTDLLGSTEAAVDIKDIQSDERRTNADLNDQAVTQVGDETTTNICTEAVPSVTTANATEATVKTVVTTDHYDEHKSQLARLLRQVSSLSGSQDIDVADQLAANMSIDQVSLAELTELESCSAPRQFAHTSELIGIEESISEENKVGASADASSILVNRWHANGRPEWAQEKFNILLLEVNGLQLAVPLMTLGQIHKIDDAITPLFGQSDWLMGLQQTSDGNVKVVDTAKYIMPERYRGRHNYKYIISIHKLLWGLAVDNVKQPIAIYPEAIKWRPKRDSRPWVAGMLKDHMCVLIDIPKLGEIFQTQDKNHVD
jgi:purine-binding chemotaxis protein CheW